MDTIKINRDVNPGTYEIEDIFVNLKQVRVLQKVFGSINELDDVFVKTKVVIDTNSHYMHVKNDDAIIVVALNHLKNSDAVTLYLDIVHELVHVKQQRQGLDLYDNSYSYVDRPTEIEAYIVAVEEAKRLGMTDEKIMDYLQMEWISSDEHKRLATRVGILS
jgi:Zn-dependent peptidase ImmA (M78 family)